MPKREFYLALVLPLVLDWPRAGERLEFEREREYGYEWEYEYDE